jgi:AcrR family transcriptional regulator
MSPPTDDPRVTRTRDRVIRATTDLLVEGGPWAVTVDAVVARSGVAKSTIYRHWDSREQLLVDMLQCNAPELAAPPDDLPVEDALRALLQSVVDVMEDPDSAKTIPMLLMLKSEIAGVAELEGRLHGDQTTMLSSILERGAAEGALRAGIDPHRAMALLLGPMTFALLSGALPADRDLAEASLEAFMAAHRA